MTTTIDRGEFGSWLFSLRSRMGLSQSKMAAKLGLTTQYYKLLELGYKCPGSTLKVFLTMMADNVALGPQPICKPPRTIGAPAVPQPAEEE